MNKPMPPCQGCEDRVVNCHDECIYYKVYKIRLENYNKKIKVEDMNYYRPRRW